MSEQSEGPVHASAVRDDESRLRRNRLILGIVIAPIGTLVALILEFMAQISYTWRGLNDGGGAAAPQVMAIVIGLLATVPGFVAGIRALRVRVAMAVAWAATVMTGIGLIAVMLLVVVPAFDILPRAARDEAAFRQQERRDELEYVGGAGPSSAEESGRQVEIQVSAALRTLSIRTADVDRRRWFTEGTTDLGNRCKIFHERITLPDDIDRKRADEELADVWGANGTRPVGTDGHGNQQGFDPSSAATLTYVRADNQLLVESDCIPFAPP